MIRRFPGTTAALILLCVLPLVCQTVPAQANVEGRVDSLLKQLSLEEKIDLIGGVDAFYIRDIPHIHFPRLKMSDGPVGVRNYGHPPQPVESSLAAAWDPDLAQRVGADLWSGCARPRGPFHAWAWREHLSLAAEWPEF